MFRPTLPMRSRQLVQRLLLAGLATRFPIAGRGALCEQLAVALFQQLISPLPLATHTN